MHFIDTIFKKNHINIKAILHQVMQVKCNLTLVISNHFTAFFFNKAIVQSSCIVQLSSPQV